VTFSRGGIITAIVAIIFLIALTYLRGQRKFRSKVLMVIFWSIILGVSVWFYASNRTSGLIENRYANQNAVGVEKQDVSTGRKDLFLTEVEAFVESPIIGIGVGKNKGYRFDKTGKVAASHNEISRLLAEHGSLGIIALGILLLVPLLLRIENNRNIYFYSFFIMWLLTINHSAMRIAFPSFIYGLCLLDVTFPKKTSLKKQVA
jgi:O-antigen ligase